MKLFSRAVGLMLVTNAAVASPVLDLGRIEVKSEQRGPQIQLVDPKRPDETQVRHTLDHYLKVFETVLLQDRVPLRTAKKVSE